METPATGNRWSQKRGAVRKLRCIGVVLVSVLVAAVFAGGSSASASKVLTLSAEELEGEALQPETSFYDNEDGAVYYSFTLKRVKVKCEDKDALLGLEGTLVSNAEPIDTLHISEGWEEFSECASHGIEAELSPLSLPWKLRVGANGRAELTSAKPGHFEVAMFVSIRTRSEELNCVFERPALNGTNTATSAEKALVVDFPLTRNKFALNAESSSGCPKTLKAGFDATGLTASVGEGAAHMFERATPTRT